MSNHRWPMSFLMLLLIASPAFGAGNDEYTKLLIHSDTTNGSTTFVDSAVGKSVGRKFDSNRAYFDGDGDYLTTPDSDDWNFASGDFTIDFWVCPSVPPNTWLYKQVEDGNTEIALRAYTDGMLRFTSRDSGGSSVVNFLTPTAILTVSEWQHIAMVRAGDNWSIYRNGASAVTTTNSGTLPDINTSEGDGKLYIGSEQVGGGPFHGYLDEFRVSKGIARWTNNFTPPTAPYAPDANTSLLLHMDGTDAVFADSGPTGHVVTANGDVYQTGEDVTYAITANGNVHHETNQMMFGNTSMRFDGNTDYLTTPDSDDWNFASGDFTIDFWVCPSVPPNTWLYKQIEDGNTEIALRAYTNGMLKFFSRDSGGSSVVNFATPVAIFTPSEWQHVAMVRAGDRWDIYRNGTSVASTTNSATLPDINTSGGDGKLYIGSEQLGGQSLDGYLDEFRISKGIARWTNNFTPPTAPYSAAGPLGTVIQVR